MVVIALTILVPLGMVVSKTAWAVVLAVAAVAVIATWLTVAAFAGLWPAHPVSASAAAMTAMIAFTARPMLNSLPAFSSLRSYRLTLTG